MGVATLRGMRRGMRLVLAIMVGLVVAGIAAAKIEVAAPALVLGAMLGGLAWVVTAPRVGGRT